MRVKGALIDAEVCPSVRLSVAVAVAITMLQLRSPEGTAVCHDTAYSDPAK